MNFLQKWKCFRFLQTKANAGFTLIELIVVIAILAILGGVAVPVYTGYVERANMAADLQLLTAINKGFASSCVSAGTDAAMIDEAEVSMADKKVTGISKAVDYLRADKQPDIDMAFQVLYVEGNADAAFKVIESLVFDAEKHMFIDPASTESITLGYAGAKITVTAAQIQALKDSSYYGEGMTSEKLLTQVDNVAVIAGAMGTITNVMGTDAYKAFALTALGITDPDADLVTVAEEIAMKKLGITDLSKLEAGSAKEAEYIAMMQQINDNALILYAANQTTELKEDAKNLLYGDDGKLINSDAIKNAMDNGLSDAEKAEGMTQAALAYGMYYAYVNSSACTDPNLQGDTYITGTEVRGALDNNTEFQNYMKSNQGQKDMEAYLEALSVIDQGATGNPAAVESLLTNGFVDLNGLLTGTMGK